MLAKFKYKKIVNNLHLNKKKKEKCMLNKNYNIKY